MNCKAMQKRSSKFPIELGKRGCKKVQGNYRQLTRKCSGRKKKGKFKLQKKSTTLRGAYPRSGNQGCGNEKIELIWKQQPKNAAE